VYPDGPGNPDIDLTPLDRVLEGKYRPGHFMGVAIVVKRFFEIVQPDNAYFGKKDYQQLLVIKRLVSMLGLPVRITGCPTLREPDGLAMSSRNLRLTPAERKTAPLIYETLCRVKERAGQFPVGELTQWAKDRINKVPSFKVEYFEIVDKEDLHALTDWNDPEKALACTAVFLGDVRLIDNFELFS
jgi:pantoate--beta-alanine ligase